MFKCLTVKVWSLEWKLVSEEGTPDRWIWLLWQVCSMQETRERGGLSTQGLWHPSQGKRYRPSLRKASYGHVSFLKMDPQVQRHQWKSLSPFCLHTENLPHTVTKYRLKSGWVQKLLSSSKMMGREERQKPFCSRGQDCTYTSERKLSRPMVKMIPESIPKWWKAPLSSSQWATRTHFLRAQVPRSQQH